jgi:hypothetical protein
MKMRSDMSITEKSKTSGINLSLLCSVGGQDFDIASVAYDNKGNLKEDECLYTKILDKADILYLMDYYQVIIDSVRNQFGDASGKEENDDTSCYSSTHYSCMTSDDLACEIVGHRISKISDTSITLDNGNILEFENCEDCCSWFVYEINNIDINDNIVTKVEVTGDEAPDEGSASWTLHILSRDKKVCDIDIDGDATNGYYCHSIELIVKKPE